MPRKRRTNMEPPSAEYAAAHPNEVIKNARGGWMWKCAHCGRPASSVTAAGLRVCNFGHGGVSEAQRDPVKRQEAIERGEDPPRPPGRPLKHGKYALRDKVRLDEIVRRYREQGVDPDDTDENMLFLHAHLEELRENAPTFEPVQEALGDLKERLGEMLEQVVKDEDMSVERVLDAIGRLQEFNRYVMNLSVLLRELRMFTAGMEERHANLVGLARVRADTRLKNNAARQLDVFTRLVQQLDVIVSEALGPDAYKAWKKRIERDLAEVSLTPTEASTLGHRA